MPVPKKSYKPDGVEKQLCMQKIPPPPPPSLFYWLFPNKGSSWPIMGCS